MKKSTHFRHKYFLQMAPHTEINLFCSSNLTTNIYTPYPTF